MTHLEELRERFIPASSVGRFAYTALDGTYLASITFDAASPQVLVAAAEKFLAFAVAKAGAIQPVGASALSALKTG
ncbi:MAG: hypothetical protein ACP5P4_08120 [Steroidobacteraceae bacterium]